MCKNAEATAANLMKAIEPTVIQLLTLEGVADTPTGQEVIKAYNAALAAVENWQPGTTSQEVVQIVNAFVAVFDTLPLPEMDKTLVSLIVSGVEGVIAVLTANQPAPAIPAEATPEQAAAAQSVHAHEVAHAALAKVKANTGIEPTFWDKARTVAGDKDVLAHRYTSEWNGEVDKLTAVEPKYAALKVA